MQFPRLVYKSADSHLLVEDVEEMKAALKNGWFATVPECSAKAEHSKAPAKPTAKTENVGNWGK